MAEAIRDGLRLEAIAADIAGDGDTALELLAVNAYDIAVLDRDIPGPSGDEIAKRIVASGSGMPILMLTAADRLDDKASGFELGADDYLTKPFELQELVLRLRALDRRRAHHRPPVREIAGLRLDPFRREVYRDGRYVALTRKQFAVLEVLVAAEGGVVSAEALLERAWDENADPFTNAVRITVSALRKRLGEPWIIATVAGAGYRIDTGERRWIGRPALSVRLKLTLSYAGLLMVAGALAARGRVGVPAALRPRPGPGRGPRPRGFGPSAPTSLDAFVPKAAIMLAFLLVFGLVGRLAARRPDARPADPHHRRHAHGRDRIARPPDPARGPQGRVPRARRRLRRHARAARGPGRRAAALRRQRLPRAAHPAGDHADPARRRPQRSRAAATTSSSTACTSSTPGRSTSPRRCSLLSRADQRSFVREHVDLSLSPRRPPRRSSRSRNSAASRSRPPATRPPPSAHPRCCCRWRRTSCTTRSSTTCPSRAPCGSRPARAPRASCSRSRTPARSSPRSWSSTLAEPFQRGSQRTRTDHAGVGLGLAIVKSIAEAHDGTLTLTPGTPAGSASRCNSPACIQTARRALTEE